MGLSVKDPEAHRLAQAIARATGESMTRVVVEALRERHAEIERRKGRASVEDLLAIADRAAALVKRPPVDQPTCSTTPRVCHGDRRHLGAGRDPVPRARGG